MGPFGYQINQKKHNNSPWIPDGVLLEQHQEPRASRFLLLRQALEWSSYSDWALLPHVFYFQGIPELFKQLMDMEARASYPFWCCFLTRFRVRFRPALGLFFDLR